MPTIVVSLILEQLALADYKANLHKTKYFEMMADARCNHFVEETLSRRKTARRIEEKKGAGRGCPCLSIEWHDVADAAFERVAVLFGYNSWVLAAGLAYYAAMFDSDESLHVFLIVRMNLSSFFTYFPLDVVRFSGLQA